MALDLELAQHVARPEWEFGKLWKAYVRCGVVYEALSLRTATEVLREMVTDHAWAAIGPSVFFEREGPYVPFDLSIVDQNLDQPIRDRPWPYCYGDDIWVCGVWGHALTVVVIDHDPLWCKLYCETPTSPVKATEFSEAVFQWAGKQAGAFLEPVAFRVPGR